MIARQTILRIFGGILRLLGSVRRLDTRSDTESMFEKNVFISLSNSSVILPSGFWGLLMMIWPTDGRCRRTERRKRDMELGWNGK